MGPNINRGKFSGRLLSRYQLDSSALGRNHCRWLRLALVSVRRHIGGVLVCILIASRPGLSQASQSSTPKPGPISLLHGQHFVCNTGYSLERCHQHSAKVAAFLGRFHNELPPNWTWILVRSDDWSGILRRLRLETHSPAFSVLEKQQTFLNEALFRTTATSSAELLLNFRVPLDQILSVALSHELGHAYCTDAHEREANRFAEQLMRTGAAVCHGSTSALAGNGHMLSLPQ